MLRLKFRMIRCSVKLMGFVVLNREILYQIRLGIISVSGVQYLQEHVQNDTACGAVLVAPRFARLEKSCICAVKRVGSVL